MIHELCITLTMRAVALGHSLYEAQYLAAIALLHLVLLCTLLGYRMVPPDEDRPEYRAVPVRVCFVPGIREIFPAATGNAGNNSRAFLQE
jgi:hypothetical protein